jgi:hypothetical protein
VYEFTARLPADAVTPETLGRITVRLLRAKEEARAERLAGIPLSTQLERDLRPVAELVGLPESALPNAIERRSARTPRAEPIEISAFRGSKYDCWCMPPQDMIDAPPLTVSRPTLELLAWVRDRERTYAETIDAWRSSCPRLTAWEDALADDLVEVVRRPDASGSTVVLTARGLDVLG